jgi:hypothetical protein
MQFFSLCCSLLSATTSACCIVGAFLVHQWKRQSESAGVTSDAQHLAARLEKVNALICIASVIRLVSLLLSSCYCAC